MRSVVVNTFLTLDGVMQSPGGPEEDPTGGFDQGGWGVTQWDEVMDARMGAFMSDPFELLLGRRTYEIFAAHWPLVTEGARDELGGTPSEIDDPAAAALNGARKYVASRTLREVTWNNSVLLTGDVGDAVAALKREDGPMIQVHGSSNLLQTLIGRGLVDEYRLWFFPVVVGSGKRLFGDGVVPAGLELVESETSTTGVIMTVYRPTGAVDRGSFAFEVPSEAELERRRHLDDA
jgi:dihydrofolate reductase